MVLNGLWVREGLGGGWWGLELCIFPFYFLFRSGRALGEGGGVWVIGLVRLMGWHGEMEVRVCLHMDW